MKFVFVVVVGVFIGVVVGGGSSLELLKGSQLLRVEAQGSRERMDELSKGLRGKVDFWLEPSTRRPTDIYVPSGGAALEAVKKYLSDNQFEFSVLIEDVEGLVNTQREEAALRNKQNGEMNWNDYQRYDVIMNFLDQVGESYPDIANVTNYGKSTEGRDLKVIKLGTPRAGKPALFLDGGMHAREWIGPAIVTYIVNELTKNRANYADILNAVDIYITPLANPDGYEYTHISSLTRMWRKTRSNHNSIVGCVGVDPNRNFDFAWGGDGTSADKCSEIYKGPSAFSEPETQAMRDLIIEGAENGGVNWTAYFAIHSYAQMWLVPWGWTSDLPPTYPELKQFGDIGAAALTQVYGTRYEVGSVTELLSPGAGGSDDWAYGSGIFKYSQTVEVRDTGLYGFLLPPELIVETAIETWAGIQAVSRFIANGGSSTNN